MDAARQEVVLQDSLAQEVITLLRAIAAKAVGCAHLVGSLVHRLDNGRTQGLCHIANAQRDDVCFWVHHFEGVHLLGYVCKQIVVWQFQEVFVY